MSVNFTKPVTSDLRADVLTYIRDYMAGQAKMFDGETLTSTPTNAIRYSAANSRFEKWNGSSWAALTLNLLPLSGGTLTGTLTGTTGAFTALTVNSNAVWHAGNLTPANYLPLAGGTMTGTLNSLNIAPTTNNTSTIGTDALRYAGVYATNFYEAGTALSSKYSAAGHTHSYLPLSGGTLTGGLTGTSGAFTSLTVGGTAVSVSGHTHSYLPLSGGSLSGGLNGTTANFSGTVTASGTLELGHATDTTLSRLAAGRIAVEGVELGYRQIPLIAYAATAAVGAVGKCYDATAGVTIPASTFAAGDCLSIYNNSAGSITITQGASLTLRQAGTANTGNRTLAQRGMATVWFRSATEAIIGGSGLS